MSWTTSFARRAGAFPDWSAFSPYVFSGIFVFFGFFLEAGWDAVAQDSETFASHIVARNSSAPELASKDLYLLSHRADFLCADFSFKGNLEPKRRLYRGLRLSKPYPGSRGQQGSIRLALPLLALRATPIL